LQINIGLENNVEGRSQAWVLDHPGCFAYGEDKEHALAETPRAVSEYVTWINRHKLDETWSRFPVSIKPEEMECASIETWEVHTIGEDFSLAQQGYEVSAWFRNDWKPITTIEIKQVLQYLSWSRLDLLDTVRDLDQEQLDEHYSGERWSIAGILQHVGEAEWWYMDRLDLLKTLETFPGRSTLP